MRTVILLMAVALSAFPQRHKLEVVDTSKPDGQVLAPALEETDQTKKAALLEEFVAKFPASDATPWALEMLQDIYGKSNQPDKVIAAGDRLLAIDPADPDAALQCLKAAEAKKDVALIQKYAAITSASAKKIASTPQPQDAGAAAAWKNEVEYAKQVDTYTEYALYRAAVESRDPQTTVALGEALAQRDPKGEYTVKLQQPLFLAYRQAGANDKALALAEQVVATDQSNEDMLLFLADNYLQNKKEPQKVHAYSVKVVELLAAKPKPEGIADADWTARKNLMMGIAHYFDGKLYWNESHFAPADQALRAALPLVESNTAMKAEVLFMLGTANYKMEKPQEAANFYRACSEIKSPFQATATKNLAAIRTQYRGIK